MTWTATPRLCARISDFIHERPRMFQAAIWMTSPLRVLSMLRRMWRRIVLAFLPPRL
ncbi:hypothetical protein [Pimelobacter simplex]|uniref:hypothetical protein n=1 Tax=Nocardioides simplex TaxID=2045 RepID=UPI0020B15597|nr:hypothetical protein [Pimelobacter simplex]